MVLTIWSKIKAMHGFASVKTQNSAKCSWTNIAVQFWMYEKDAAKIIHNDIGERVFKDTINGIATSAYLIVNE